MSALRVASSPLLGAMLIAIFMGVVIQPDPELTAGDACHALGAVATGLGAVHVQGASDG
jgi:hypothetical protein